MPRSKTSDGKRVTICAKVSEPVAEAIDAARGDLSRSAWLQSAVMAGLRGSAGHLAVQMLSGIPEPAAPHRCPVKGWCGTCRDWKGAKV